MPIARASCASSMGRSNLLGGWGEALAAEYLRKKRYQIVAQGYRCRFGEIDLIVKNKKYLAFVEVKLRKPPGSNTASPDNVVWRSAN